MRELYNGVDRDDYLYILAGYGWVMAGDGPSTAISGGGGRVTLVFIIRVFYDVGAGGCIVRIPRS